jgi:hypothetical protein
MRERMACMVDGERRGEGEEEENGSKASETTHSKPV